MSKKIFIHEYKTENRMNDDKDVHEEYLRDGAKGMSFKVLKLSKGKKEAYMKVSGKELEDGNFGVTVKKDGKEEKMTLNKKDFITFIKKHKELAFLEKYISKEMEKFRKTLKGGRRSSRKGSRKGSKKASKKRSKRASRKGSRKGSRKASKKRSKRASRKGSKKSKRKY